MALIDVYEEDMGPNGQLRPLSRDAEGNEINGSVERSVAHSQGLWHRNTYVLICPYDNGRGTPEGTVLMQLRNHKAVYPKAWSVPAEHPMAGESDSDAILRGLWEEHHIRVQDFHLISLGTYRPVTLMESVESTDREFQKYFAVRWTRDLEARHREIWGADLEEKLPSIENDPSSFIGIWYNRSEVTEAQAVNAYKIGESGYPTPLGRQDLRNVMDSVVGKGLLRRRHLREPRNGARKGKGFFSF